MAELKLPVDAVAATAFRVWCRAAHLTPPLWSHLTVGDQAPWLNMARHYPHALINNEGLPWSAAARALARLFANGDPDPDPDAALELTSQMPWEAVARHLAFLFDSDEVTDLTEAEDYIVGWAHKRSVGSREVGSR